MGVKKVQNLNLVFIKYVITLFVGFGLSAIIPFALLLLGIFSGVISQSNTGEIEANNAAEQIRKNDEFNRIWIPDSCEYMLLDYHNQIIESNMNEEVQDSAINYANGTINRSKYNFIVIEKEKYICILRYHIGALYSVKILNSIFFNPDTVEVILILINCCLSAGFITIRYTRKMKKQLIPLFQVAEMVKEENLDFEISNTSIKEFNDVLEAFCEMKEQLRISFEAKWKSDYEKKSQIMALSHDLKTPLTVLVGNIELLDGTELDTEQRECLNYLKDSTNQMQKYIMNLIDLSKLDVVNSSRMQKVSSKDFVQKIVHRAIALAKLKKIEVVKNINIEEECFQASEDSLERAIMNIVDNAIQHSKSGSKIEFICEVNEDRIRFCIIDSGKGFSKLDLKNAKDRFYMGDKSRNEISRNHYGIGLYVADVVAKQHGGKLILENSKEHSGKVTIQFNLNK